VVDAPPAARYGAGMIKTVKLADVARAAGVSQGTVSNVFNRPDLVSPELRERVEAAARTLGYRGPDPRGRLLRAGRVNAIGVVSGDPLATFFADPYDRRLLTGIARGCDDRGAGIALVSAIDDEAAGWNLRTALVDGFILNCLVEGSRLVDHAARRGLPFVAVDHSPGNGADVVQVDDRAGARLAAAHLADLGHRRFAVLALGFDVDRRVGWGDRDRVKAIRYDVVRNRLAGFRDALDAVGAPEPLVWESPNTAAGAAAGVTAVLARDPAVTAFLCMSDVLAMAALDALRAAGRRVPDDVSVTGYDDVDAAATVRPALTTVHQPIEEKGAAAIRMVFDGDAEDRGRRVVTLPVSLVVRGSTGPAPRR